MVRIVWFKRDLRVFDHQPLAQAARGGRVLPVYIFEPSIWSYGDLSQRHFDFVAQSLHELWYRLRARGVPLHCAITEMIPFLEQCKACFGSFELYSHVEHGAEVTFKRDRAVREWMKRNEMNWHEFYPFGVKRGSDRAGDWRANWYRAMEGDILPPPDSLAPPAAIPSMLSTPIERVFLQCRESKIFGGEYGPSIETSAEWLFAGSKPLWGKDHYARPPGGQTAGEKAAYQVFEQFLAVRSRSYTYNVKKPLAAHYSTSRLSPHLSWGNISLRYVARRTNDVILNCTDEKHRSMLERFFSRLRWHCRFIQELEDRPQSHELDYDRILTMERSTDHEVLRKWVLGLTGFPLIDAVMRSLRATGYANFHCRAMTVSFICNTMLQDWKVPSRMLANLFLDYEPGIHFVQMQMQAATWKQIHVPLYDPIKQSHEQDADGHFIRYFVPELRAVPTEYIHEPHLWPGFAKTGYPLPIVDLRERHMLVRELLWKLKKGESADVDDDSTLF